MSCKIAFTVLISVAIFQILLWESEASIVRRATDQTNSSQNSLDDALAALKQGIDDISKKIENNEAVQSLQQSLNEFGQQLQQQGQQLLEKVQKQKATTT